MYVCMYVCNVCMYIYSYVYVFKDNQIQDLNTSVRYTHEAQICTLLYSSFWVCRWWTQQLRCRVWNHFLHGDDDSSSLAHRKAWMRAWKDENVFNSLHLEIHLQLHKLKCSSTYFSYNVAYLTGCNTARCFACHTLPVYSHVTSDGGWEVL